MMDREVISVNARRLRMARQLSQREVAEAAGISLQGYRNIETGQSKPRPTTLQAVADALGVSLGELVRPVQKLEGVRFRAQKKLTMRHNILADVARLVHDYQVVERLVADEVPFNLSQVADRLHGAVDRVGIGQRAAAFARDALGLNASEPIRDICGLVESAGIKLLPLSIASDGFFGLSVSDRSGGPAIVVNTWERISVERWIFTTAHELGHLLLHHHAYTVDQVEEDPTEEQEANDFASHFLMPQDVFSKEWRQTEGLHFLDRVFKLKRMFHVSYKVVLYRLSQHPDYGQSVWGRFQGLYRQRYGRTLRGADEPLPLTAGTFLLSLDPESPEPEALGRLDFVPDRRSRLVRTALEQGLITLSKAADVSNVSLEDMRRITASWCE